MKTLIYNPFSLFKRSLTRNPIFFSDYTINYDGLNDKYKEVTSKPNIMTEYERIYSIIDYHNSWCITNFINELIIENYESIIFYYQTSRDDSRELLMLINSIDTILIKNFIMIGMVELLFLSDGNIPRCYVSEYIENVFNSYA